jgi:hypothetical protein
MKQIALLLISTASLVQASPAGDTLSPLTDGKIPTTLDQLWEGFDPRREALNVERCKEWTLDGVVCQVVRIDIGSFKGQRSKLALLYAFPKGARKLPGLMQIHGGGQSANLDACVADALRGYTSISINWGGNPLNLGRSKISYDGPNTDWGALDATHVPQRQKVNHFAGSIAPDAFALDPVDSPRNSNWFLVLIAARRALTFLEQQPEVDSGRLGVYGHSMGGKLTTDLAGIDPRIKAAVPSCGGSGDIPGTLSSPPPGTQVSEASPLLLATISDNAYIPRIHCPVLWLSPTNDFHAHIGNMAWTWREVPDSLLRLSIAPHLNHRHTDDHALTQHLWFEQHLKGAWVAPATPPIRFSCDQGTGVPRITVLPDATVPIARVQVYYSTDPHELTRFWRSAPTIRSGTEWTADCPLLSLQQPFFAYANVSYETPARYRDIAHPPGSGNSPVFTFSSRLLVQTPQQLVAAGAKATDVAHERMIDEGLREWQDWYRLNWGNPGLWVACTRKLKDARWLGPEGGMLSFDVRPTRDCTLVVTVFINEWGAFPGRNGIYHALRPLRGSAEWQTVSVSLADLRSADERTPEPLTSWQTVTQLQLSPTGSLLAKDGSKTEVGGKPWEDAPGIRLRNLRWEGGSYRDADVAPAVLKKSRDFDQEFNEAIRRSLEQERRDRANSGEDKPR